MGAASGGNLQPWRVYVVTGDSRDEICTAAQQLFDKGMLDGQSEYNIYPPHLTEPYRTRRRDCGKALYGAVGVSRNDLGGKLALLRRNFEFFGAPVGLVFTVDRQMCEGQWADVGGFLQTLLLLATERGLATCAQEAWANYHEMLRSHLPIADEEIVFCGVALGYPNKAAKINSYRTERASMDEVVSFHPHPSQAATSRPRAKL